MRRLVTFLAGISVGLSGAALILRFFSPVSRAELKTNFNEHVAESMQIARRAATAKRAELERELVKPRPAPEKPVTDLPANP